jgi:DNA anti-recombination protein RmuC
MQNTTLVVALFLSALAVFLQAAVTVSLWIYFRKMQAAAAEMKQRLDPLIQSSLEIVSNAREPLRKIGGDLAQISGMIQERTSDVDAFVADFVEKSRTQLTRLDQILADILDKAGAQVTRIDQIVSNETGNVDELVTEVVERARAQVARFDEALSDVVQKIETTSEIMQRKALAPINEVAAVIKGLQAGLQLFFSTRRRSPGGVSETVSQDEQLFI